jgi:hypothetical protein
VLDLRYHVASLSAVFLALIIGILVGVGISGRGFVDKSERRNFENRIAALQSRVDQLSAEKALIGQQGLAARTFAEDTYPVLMHNRLAGRRVALIVIGSGNGAVGDARQALADAGATVSVYRVLRVPIPAAGVRKALAGTPGFRKLDDVGHELGQEWLTHGLTPISDAVSSLVVEEQRGAAGSATDGAVVVEGGNSADPASQQFVTGLLGGLAGAGVPVVGAEETASTPSNVPRWRQVSGMSSVDALDTASGKLALALVLGGAPSGHFGVKATADATLPRIEAAG